MGFDSVLEKIERLLKQGRNSQATDLLTEFLLELYGKPMGLVQFVPTLNDLSQKTPDEIVSILKASLSRIRGGLDDCDDLSEDDFEAIESTSHEIESRNLKYELDEEFDIGRQMEGAEKTDLGFRNSCSIGPRSSTAREASLHLAQPSFVDRCDPP